VEDRTLEAQRVVEDLTQDQLEDLVLEDAPLEELPRVAQLLVVVAQPLLVAVLEVQALKVRAVLEVRDSRRLKTKLSSALEKEVNPTPQNQMRESF